MLTPTGPGTRGHTAGARGSERPAGQRPWRGTGTRPARGSREARVRVREGGGAAPAARPAPGAQQAHGQTSWAGASLRLSSPSGRAEPPRFPWRPYCEVGVWSEQLLDGAPAREDKRPAGPPRPPWAPRPLAPRHPLPPPRPPLPQRNPSGASLQGLFNELHISARTRGFNGLLYSVLQDSSANPAPAEGTSWWCK